MASDQRVSLAHPSISISIFNQRFATFSVAAFQPIISAPLPQGVLQTFFRRFHCFSRTSPTVQIHRKNRNSSAIVPPVHPAVAPLSNQQQLRHTTADAHANGLRTGKEPLKALFFAPDRQPRPNRTPRSRNANPIAHQTARQTARQTADQTADQMPPLGIEPRTY
jgi:hypothetical protein